MPSLTWIIAALQVHILSNRACTFCRHFGSIYGMLVIMLVSCFFGQCLVIHWEMICRYGETLLWLKLPQRCSCETWQNKGPLAQDTVYLRWFRNN